MYRRAYDEETHTENEYEIQIGDQTLAYAPGQETLCEKFFDFC